MKRNSYFLAAILIVALYALAFIVCASAPPDNLELSGWRVEIWRLKPLTGDYLKVVPGQILAIEWEQPQSRQKYEDQPSYGIGDTTGWHTSFFVKISDARTLANNTYMAEKSITLAPGYYSLIIYAVDTNGAESKHSKPYWFQVAKMPPNMPIEVKLWVK